MFITGAAAAHGGRTRRSRAGKSFGANIRLPWEQSANPVIAEDKKLVTFNISSHRKLSFIRIRCHRHFSPAVWNDGRRLRGAHADADRQEQLMRWLGCWDPAGGTFLEILGQTTCANICCATS